MYCPGHEATIRPFVIWIPFNVTERSVELRKDVENHADAVVADRLGCILDCTLEDVVCRERYRFSSSIWLARVRKSAEHSLSFYAYKYSLL